MTQKADYVGAPAIFKLNLACMSVYQAFCVGGKYGGIFLVGSALIRADWRDVDVVCILDDGDFASLFPDAHIAPDTANFELDPRWLLLTVSISAWLSQQSGLPVDFKFHPMTFANKWHDKPRHAIGHRTVAKRLEGVSNA